MTNSDFYCIFIATFPVDGKFQMYKWIIKCYFSALFAGFYLNMKRKFAW